MHTDYNKKNTTFPSFTALHMCQPFHMTPHVHSAGAETDNNTSHKESQLPPMGIELLPPRTHTTPPTPELKPPTHDQLDQSLVLYSVADTVLTMSSSIRSKTIVYVTKSLCTEAWPQTWQRSNSNYLIFFGTFNLFET